MFVCPTEINYRESTYNALRRYLIFPEIEESALKKIYSDFRKFHFGVDREGFLKINTLSDYFEGFTNKIIFEDVEHERKGLLHSAKEHTLKQINYKSHIIFPLQMHLTECEQKRDEYMNAFTEFLFKQGICFAEHLLFAQDDDTKKSLETIAQEDNFNSH